ncbi:MAG: EpsG family protein [Clostridia bacterium]|nr:EpsG family protein [Clostridia bacterium]
MTIILGVIAILFGLSQVFAHSEKKDKIYLWIIWAVLVFITAFRSIGFYTDTKVYKEFYEMYSEMSIKLRYYTIFKINKKDPVYHFLSSTLGSMGLPFRVWLLMVSVLYYTGFIYALRRFSQIPFLTTLGLTCISYVFFTMTGIRQTMAMGFCFFAFVKAYDRKPIQFALFVFLGYLFHSSCIIFILTYFLINKKFGIVQILLVVASATIAFLFPSAINEIVRTLAWNDDVEKYADVTTGLSIFGYVVQLGIAVICFVLQREYCLEDREGRALLNMIVLGLVFQIFAIRIDNIFRMSMYFSVYGMFMIANVVSKFEKESNYWWAYWLVFAVFLAYMLYARSYTGFSLFGG